MKLALVEGRPRQTLTPWTPSEVPDLVKVVASSLRKSTAG
jgi:hypothetical protein